MRRHGKRVLAPLTAGVFAVGGLAYATVPGSHEAKGDSAPPSGTPRAAGPARGYALVSFTGKPVTSQSKGVVGVRQAVDTNSKQVVVFGAYCFDLTFSPVNVIGSSVADDSDSGSRAFTVSTAGPNVGGVLTRDDGRPIECPMGFRDAAVVIRSPAHRLSMSTGGVFMLFN
jgi:hypothetical protein